MIPPSAPPIDGRDTNAVLAEFQNRRRGYLPRWNPPAQSSGAAMGPIFARLIYAILERLNHVPAKDKLVFLDLLGIRLIAAQPARAPIVFSLTAGASDCSAPEGTQVAAPPPPGGSNQIVFSTEQDAAVAAANLVELVSLWPGRDQYIDHSAAIRAGQPFTLFQNLQLSNTPHMLYLAHSKILAFAGSATIKVGFDLTQGSSSPLEIAWEYWDGKVWRAFVFDQESCLGVSETGYDGTNGLSTSGSVQLQTAGAPASLTTVNGVKSYWVRGRLTQQMLPVQGSSLPEVDSIRLTTLIDQRLELKVTATIASSSGASTLVAYDENGQQLDKVTVTITPPNGSAVTLIPQSDGTYIPGIATIAFNPGDSLRFDVSYQNIIGTAYAVYAISGGSALFTLIVKVEGLLPDKAFTDGKSVDTTKAFFPLGQAPVPGTTFYFKQTEVFSKTAAVVSVYIAPAPMTLPTTTTGSGSGGSAPNPVAHTINWEYWNGFEWTLLAQSTLPNSTLSPPLLATKDFTVTEIVQFTIPADMVATTVNNDTGLYIRARLAAGGYGICQKIALPSGSSVASITYVQPRPPAVSVFRFGYTWTQGPYPLEQVFTYNDFQYQDHTNDALWPGNPFAPYQPVGDVTPSVYLGFDKLLPVNNYGVYFDIAEQAGVETGPAMAWEYWNGGGWESVSAEDETQALALPGMITFLPAADAQALARFDAPLYWLRGKLKEDQPPNETTIEDVHTNAVWASQWQTFQNSPLGVSTAVPSQIFQFNQIPILPGQEIEVEELSGPRANTEWRTIAIQVIPDDPNIVTEFETLLAAEGTQTDIIIGDVHLVRNKTKSVTAVLVRWQEAKNFFDSGPSDRVYVLDHALGRLFFGDGNSGMIPPLGAAIQGTSFRSGGGLAGNVKGATITQLLGSLSGISGVTNPRAAEGGADGETLEEYQARAPLTLSDRGRAIVAQDYETMAHEASAGVAVARAMGPLDPSGRPVPGWVTVMIIPRSSDPRPTPSAGLRQDVLNYLLSRAPADVVAGQRINVIGPTYVPVDVKATLAPTDPVQAGKVEADAIRALEAFLNPLIGGPEGLGWDVGRGLYASDIAGVLGDVTGVDYVESLALSVDGVLQGDQVRVPTGQIVVAGVLEISLVLPATI